MAAISLDALQEPSFWVRFCRAKRKPIWYTLSYVVISVLTPQVPDSFFINISLVPNSQYVAVVHPNKQLPEILQLTKNLINTKIDFPPTYFSLFRKFS